jgi:restriction system protein
VQVKSSETPVDAPTLQQLIGAMQSVHADQGLLVSWGGFKSTVESQRPTQFFRVRLWDQRQLVEELLRHYHQLDPEIRAELPLKQIWVVAKSTDGE